jgi:bacteriocin biosynthesis cyclodehydratase domain-containing protein
VVLAGLSAGDERVMALLDGSLDLPGVLERATSLGVAAARVRQLVAALTEAGVLLARPGPPGAPAARRPPRRSAGEQQALVPDAQLLSLVHPAGDGWGVLSRRWRSTARVVGASRTGLAVALGLADAGLGRVLVEDAGAVGPGDVSPGGYRVDDVGHPRAGRAAALVRARCPVVLTEPAAHPTDPDVVVLVAAGAVDPARADALVGAGVPHLAVLWREGTTVVGPLVRPGASACLRCLDAHRTDRDPQWPLVLGQLTGPSPGSRTRPEETALAALTASLAVVQVLAQIDGVPRPAALGATLETALPHGLVAQRPWSPHPRCGCTWPGAGQGPA